MFVKSDITSKEVRTKLLSKFKPQRVLHDSKLLLTWLDVGGKLFEIIFFQELCK